MNSHPDRPARIRAFVAACLPDELLHKITAEQERLGSKLGSGHVRWTRPEQLHLTLKFLGNVGEGDLPELKEALQRAARPIPPFQLKAGTLGCFPSCRRPSVIWLGLNGDLGPLQRLQTNLDQQCHRFGSHSETREFHPHLTIARVKGGAAELRALGGRLGSETVGELGWWLIDRIVLMRSQLTSGGSIYTQLIEVALPGA